MPEFYANTIAQVADLIPYAMNSRTHSEEQVAQIAASIREFGFTNPVLIDEANNLIAGHGRVLAARKLNLDQVPAVVAFLDQAYGDEALSQSHLDGEHDGSSVPGPLDAFFLMGPEIYGHVFS